MAIQVRLPSRTRFTACLLSCIRAGRVSEFSPNWSLSFPKISGLGYSALSVFAERMGSYFAIGLTRSR